MSADTLNDAEAENFLMREHLAGSSMDLMPIWQGQWQTDFLDGIAKWLAAARPVNASIIGGDTPERATVHPSLTRPARTR